MKLLGYAVLCGFDGALGEAHVPLASDLLSCVPSSATAIAHGFRLATEETSKLFDGQQDLVVGLSNEALRHFFRIINAHVYFLLTHCLLAGILFLS